MLFPLTLALRFRSVSLKKSFLSYSMFPQSVLLQIALLSSFDTPFFPSPLRDSPIARVKNKNKNSLLSFHIKDASFLKVLSNKVLQMPCIMIPLCKCKLSLCWHYLFHYMVHFYLPLPPASSSYWQPDGIIHKV